MIPTAPHDNGSYHGAVPEEKPVMHDAKAIRRRITVLKQKAHDLAAGAAASAGQA